MKNAKLGREVLDTIDAHPEQFNMDVWAQENPVCGVVACLAGHAMLLSGYKWDNGTFFRPNGSEVPVGCEAIEARRLLGMTIEDELSGSASPDKRDKDGLPDQIWFDWMNGPDRFRKLVEESEGRVD